MTRPDQHPDAPDLATLAELGVVGWQLELPSLRVLSMSAGVRVMLGHEPSDALGQDGFWEAVCHPSDRPQLEQARHDLLDTGESWATFRAVTAAGAVVWLAERARRVDGRVVGVTFDVTDSPHWREAPARAQTDHLTGLWDRPTFEHDLDDACADCGAGVGAGAALLFLDLNGFKLVNDRHGHAAGDDVLRETARRLRLVVRANERCYRLSGDEFVVVCRTRTQDEAAAAAAAVERRIKDALAEPITAAGVDVTVVAAVGAAVCPRDAAAPEGLIAHADQAMYADKRASKLAARAHVGYDT